MAMTVVDRFLTALGQYLENEAAVGYTVRLRDYDGTKGADEVVLDAQEAQEHAVMRGNFEVQGTLELQVEARDTTAAARRDKLGELAEAMADDGLVAWLSDTLSARGLDVDEPLTVYRVTTSDGHWEPEDKRIIGTVEWRAWIVGA